LKANSSQPFFLFLHIYDLHTPYNLSAEEKAKYGEGYDGELGYIDDIVGQFWEFLVARDLVNKSLIVFTSDHGESLGEHGESTHGFFIYQSTLHVPLIVHWPNGGALLPTRVDSPASLLDVMPTILSVVRLPVPGSLQGRSLLKPAENASDVYSESVYPHKHFAASALASLRRGHYKYIDAPKPEFFDLTQDPEEANNLYATKEAIALGYRERLNGLRQLYQPHLQRARETLSPEAIERLHALGYLTGNSSVGTSSQRLADPKEKIVDYEEYGRATRLAALGHLEEANVLLEGLLKKDPDLLDVRLSLGLNQQRLGRDLEALELFREVLVADPMKAIVHFDAGLSYYNLRRFDEAAEELKAAVVLSPDYTKAEELLGNILLQKQDYDQARARFEHILQTTPDDYQANYNLGVLAVLKGDWEDGVKYLRAALTIDPGSAEGHNTLGSLYLRKGEPESARSEFEEAIRLKPGYAWAHYNLGLVYRGLKELGSARIEFQKALTADPEFRVARDALTHLEQSQQ
jgi:tetratricopeptide (TPR) repeat protein